MLLFRFLFLAADKHVDEGVLEQGAEHEDHAHGVPDVKRLK